jgi:hypothetical protein
MPNNDVTPSVVLKAEEAGHVAEAVVASPAPAAPAKKAETKALSVFETAMVVILVSVISIACYDHFFAQKLVVADLEALSANLTRAVSEKYITQEQGLERIGQAKAIVNKSGKKNIVILASVVLGDTSKYTYLELPFVSLPEEPKVPVEPTVQGAAQ